jgi:hypothetical protein
VGPNHILRIDIRAVVDPFLVGAVDAGVANENYVFATLIAQAARNRIAAGVPRLRLFGRLLVQYDESPRRQDRAEDY